MSISPNGSPFVWQWQWALDHIRDSLGPSCHPAIALYCALMETAFRHKSFTFAEPQEKIAARAGITKKGARPWLRKLVACGLVSTSDPVREMPLDYTIHTAHPAERRSPDQGTDVPLAKEPTFPTQGTDGSRIIVRVHKESTIRGTDVPLTPDAPKPVTPDAASTLFAAIHQELSKAKAEPTQELPSYQRNFKRLNGYLPPTPPAEDEEPDF